MAISGMKAVMKRAALVLLLLLLAGCSPSDYVATEAAAGVATSPTPKPEYLLAAGDIASCAVQGDEQTAAILRKHKGTVAPLGDLAYERGTTAEFANCYEPSWGTVRNRTRPAVGNHEYASGDGAAAYFHYFGARAGEPGKGYYSYDLGTWHVIVLNSNCTAVSCAAGSAQEKWLRADLAATKSSCVLAYWHHPRWSSGPHGSSTAVAPFWSALYEKGADVVLVGHDHDYERFEPLNSAGQIDQVRGIRQFVVGTGGRSLYRIGTPITGSAARNDRAFGVLKLTLEPGGYKWEFLAANESPFKDSGVGKCH